MPRATVLVVDDESLIRWSLVSRLKEEGYQTLEAGTAADAVAQHREGADLVLLDVGLPDASGLTVLAQRAVRIACACKPIYCRFDLKDGVRCGIGSGDKVGKQNGAEQRDAKKKFADVHLKTPMRLGV